MKIKQFVKKVVREIKDTGKAALYTLPFWLPQVLEAKALDLQATKTVVTQDYMHGAWLKASKTGNSFYAGSVTDLGHGFYFDAGVSNSGINGAILGKDLGLEASTDLKGKKRVSLDARVLGTGFSATGTVDSEGKTAISGSAFRAEQIGKGTYFGKIDVSKDNVAVSGLGFYVGPTIGSLTLVPLAYFSKPVTSSGYYFMTGAVGLNGKVSVSGTVGTSDFKDFAPSLKVAYKF